MFVSQGDSSLITRKKESGSYQYVKAVPGSILQTSGFMNNKWTWSHQVPDNFSIGLTKQLLYLIECLPCKTIIRTARK